jgi:acyl carrier protein
MSEFLHERVCEVVAQTLGVDPADLTADSSTQTVAAWSSLAHLRLLSSLEQAFGVRFTMAEMTSMSSIAAIEHVLTDHGIAVQ